MNFASKHQRKVNEVYPSKPGEDGPVPTKISSLTYYLNARPGKIFKVMSYLERKTDRDLYKEKTGYNKVTLEILDNLFMQCSIHFPIYYVSCLRIVLAMVSAGDNELFIRTISTVLWFLHF